MKLRIAVTLLVVLFTGAPDAAAQTPPVFSAQVDSVFIDAFVTRAGTSVSGLTERNFVLKDNGVTQPFDLVPADSLPIRAILVFDTSSSMRGAKLERLRAAAQSFLDQLRPQDEAGLVAFSDEIVWPAPLSSDRVRVRAALGSITAQGATSIYDALFTALVVPKSASRTLVILFSDGEDTMSWLGEQDILRLVERSNALIHVVAAPSEEFGSGPVGGPRSDSAYVKTLRHLAETTGGSLIEVRSPERIGGAFSQIIESMKSRYVLRYAPETELTPGWHKLDLQLKSTEGKVRGRSGYWVEKR